MQPISDFLCVPETAPTTSLAVPEWGHDAAVICKTLTADELDKVEIETTDDNGKLILEGFRLAYVAACLVRPDGTKLFDTPEKVERLRKWGAVVVRLYGECRKFNGSDNAVKNG